MLEKHLHTQGVSSSLNDLVTFGCDRQEVLSRLELVNASIGQDTWERVAGRNRKQLDATLRRIKRTAEEIEGLNSYPIGGWATSSQRIFYYLPRTLRWYVQCLEALGWIAGPKPKFRRNLAVAFLVAYVLERTKTAHDRQVGDLLGAILGPEWNADSLKTWRKTHRREIAGARRQTLAEKVRLRKPQRGFGSPPVGYLT